MESKDNNFTSSIERSNEKSLDIYIDPMLPYIEENHLDIGCGSGTIINRISNRKKESNITALDINEDLIELARTGSNSDRIYYISDINSIEGKKFESASAIFVLHEAAEKTFEIAKKKLKKNGKLAIIDYNLIKDIKEGEDIKSINDIFYSLEEFKNIFSTQKEKKEIKELGLMEAYRIHTNFNLNTCKKMAEKSGFKTIESKKLNNKYFFWAGSKI